VSDNPLVLAGRLGHNARLRTVELQELHWQVHPTVEQLIDITPELALDVRGNLVGEALNYAVFASVEAKLESEQQIFGVGLRYVVGLVLPDDMDAPTEDEIKAYGAVTIIPLVLPYLRAVVTDLTSKAGLPPLVLETVRIPLPGRPRPEHPLEYETGVGPAPALAITAAPDQKEPVNSSP
jgi:preprotein translocase subunit SecB